MVGKFTNSTMIRLLVITVLAVTLTVGCSRSPLDTADNNVQPQLMRRSAGPGGSALLSGASFYVEQVVSAAEGARIELVDVVLDIPAGAIDNDTLFSIRIPDIEMFYNEFGTSGLVFNKPVTVTMSYRDADLTGINESTIRIAWLNTRTGRWENVICTVNKIEKTVTGQLSHFSAYGLISD